MPQILRPNSDISNAGSWTTTPLFSKINDGSDSTFVSAPSGTNPGAEFVVSVDNGSAPQSGTREITVRCRKSATAGQTRNLVVELRNSAGTLIQAFTGVAITAATFENFTFTVTNSISSYTGLQLSIYDERGGGGAGRFLDVSDAFFTIPDAAPTYTINGGVTDGGETVSSTATFEAADNDREINGGVTDGNETVSSTATFEKPIFELNGGVTDGSETVSGTATFGAPQFELNGGVVDGSETVSSTAEFVKPVYELTGGVVDGNETVSATAIFSFLQYEINGGVTDSNEIVEGTISTAEPSGLIAAHYMNGAFALGRIKVYSGGSWKNVKLYRYKYNKWNGTT